MPLPGSRIAIIGGGFSGTLALANLVRETDRPLSIEIFDASGEVGQGVAYGTQDISHLLNVRADRMGAYSGEPSGFWDWLQSEGGAFEAKRICPDARIAAESFLPRKLYAVYLQAVFAQAVFEAREKGVKIQVHHAQVLDAIPHMERLRLTVESEGNQRKLVFDAGVLATGNLRPRSFGFEAGMIEGREGYISDIWHPQPDSLYPNKVSTLPQDSEVVIIGTGLTTVDAILTLRKNGYKGLITAISRHGWLPLPHAAAKPYPAWEWNETPEHAPNTAMGLLIRLRGEIRKAQDEGYDWRAVVDSIRPVTQQLWKRLNVRERRRFFRKLFTVWNIHRHRMAPELHAVLAKEQEAGTLRIVAGSLYYVGSEEKGLNVAYRLRGANRLESVHARLVLNCTGPQYDIATGANRLLANLRDRGIITAGPLRTGIEMESGKRGWQQGSAKGSAPGMLYPIGTLLVGELLECTAVPELRERAKQLSIQLLQNLGQ
ncbi:MAG: hypothetical protein FJX23_04370 [Alphaproteobacteria bacterium]|nr:hypothetical protein [Alphaproteobacteria bacterium]